MKNAKNTFRSFGLTALAGLGLVALSSAATESIASAQEIQLTGPLAGAPAVKKLREHRRGRFEIAPSFTFSLLDEYRRTILMGARLQYSLTDWLGIGVWGGFGAVSYATDLTDQVQEKAPKNSRTATNRSSQFEDQVGKVVWTAAPQITLVPFRGKISIFQKIFLDTDAYFHGGVAFVGLKERADCSGAACAGNGAAPGTVLFPMTDRMAIAPTFGLGLNFYMNNFLSLGFEYRAIPYAWNRGGFDANGAGSNGKFPDGNVSSEDRTFKFNQMMSVNIGFSLPTRPSLSE